ncbi:MAG: helix-turn-helix transcriptional regulator [Polyangiales bacterium]
MLRGGTEVDNEDLAASQTASATSFSVVVRVGVAPMEYLTSWRMTVARDLLRQQGRPIAEVAERVGYASASTFSTAFRRHVGQPPRQYARAS